MSAVAHEAPGYRAISARSVRVPMIAGGVLAIVGGLGVWVRALQATQPGADSVQVATLNGAAHAAGWVIAALGAVAAGTAFLLGARRRLFVALPAGAAVAAMAMVVEQLRWASSTSTSMARAQRGSAGASFALYHAGFGWGAWMMALAAGALAIGLVAGAMWLVDSRKDASR